MQVRRYEDVREFYPIVEPFLLQREAEHCLQLGVLNTLLQTEPRNPPYLVTVEQDGQILAVATRTRPYGVVISHVVNPESVTLIADDVVKTFESDIRTVQSGPDVCAAFAARIKALVGLDVVETVNERIYELETVTHPQGVAGNLRHAMADDREILIQWLGEFYAEAFGGPQPREELELQTDIRLNAPKTLRGLVIWEVDGVPVSYAGFAGPTPNGMRIGPVYTPPEHRKRGYGSAMTAALSQWLLDGGRSRVFLFTDLANPTSNHIYQSVGYRPVVDNDQLSFGKQN